MTMTNEKWREHQYYKFDPLSDEIQPALLNSSDIQKYIDIGCLIEKINFDSNRLKPASYEMRLLGELYDWRTTSDGKLQRRCRKICDGEKIELSRNSITYLWMDENLLLPEYIAARFNLHIRCVHKGILLGTGPLVDPGFFGSLLIPLHNLTDNDYELKGGEGVIWVEFTKVSKHAYWMDRGIKRPSDLKPFPNRKDLDDPDLYFSKSGVTDMGGVQSAFHGSLEKTVNLAEDACKSATDAREDTKKLEKRYTNFGLTAIAVIVIALAAIIMQGLSLTNQVIDIANGVNLDQIEVIRNIQHQSMNSIQKQVVDLETRINGYSAELNTLKGQIDLVNEKRDVGRNLAQ